MQIQEFFKIQFYWNIFLILKQLSSLFTEHLLSIQKPYSLFKKKEIPLYVKSFLNPEGTGTAISRGVKIKPEIPCFIVKRNLNLLKLSTLDFSFIVEENISEIFQILHENKMKVDLIQNSAISFSVCVYDKFDRLKELISILKATFKVESMKLSLIHI